MQQPEQKTIRPSSLSFLCVLTFIGSGFSAFSYFVFSAAIDTVRQVVSMDEFKLLQSSEDLEMVKKLLDLPRLFFVLNLVLYIGSLSGAILMWQLKKAGFHLYSISQIFILIVYSIYIPASQFPFFSLFITVFFILLYAIHLRYLK